MTPLRARVAVFSVDRGAVDVEASALVVTDAGGVRAQLPVGATAVLMLEPGTTISHAAVKLCAENRTLILWTGEAGVRVYSAGQEGAAHSYRLLRQARLALDPQRRLAVVREMYRIRFYDEPPAKRSVEQLRGMEGARVKAAYAHLAATHGVAWTGRNYDRTDWDGQNAVNRALSSANACLYGLSHAAILISGYSAALGFVHTGYPLAFVHDLADLYKMELAAPAAFRAAAEDGGPGLEMRVRHTLRDAFRRVGLLEKIIPGIESLLDAGEAEAGTPEELGGCRAEAARPEDAPWQPRPRLPDAREVAAEMAVDRPPKPSPRAMTRDEPLTDGSDDGLPF